MVTIAVVVAVAAMQMPGMSTSIGCIECRTSEVEIITVWIAGIDAEVPITCAPV
jgi:hypothetical protein